MLISNKSPTNDSTLKGKHMIDLSVNLAGMVLQNPIIPASGTFDAECFAQIAGFDVRKLGAIMTKGTTCPGRHGNAQPRMLETHSGMLNFIGLQNPGVDVLVKEKLPHLLKYNVPVIVNVCGSSVQEYVDVVTRLEQDTSGVIWALEINISCPNVKEGGAAFGQSPEKAAEVLRAVRPLTHRVLIAKLTPKVTSAIPIAQAVIEAGADAISACNTFLGMRKIWNSMDRGKYVRGGLSGQCIMPIALAIVSDLAKANLGKPVIGIGGIETARDAIEFLEQGATAVQVGTANFRNPLAMMHIIRDLRLYIEASGCHSLQEWRTNGFPMPLEKNMPEMA